MNIKEKNRTACRRFSSKELCKERGSSIYGKLHS